MPHASHPELEGLPKLGTVLGGKYRLERVLGIGGMGAVMQAEHEQLGEQVAIKFLLGTASQDPDRVKRFSREAWAAAKIKSEHVVRVLDVASMEDGTPYLVLEYLDGEDLDEVLTANRRLPLATAVDYVLQAAEALSEAHKLGIIHRDLKPGNLHRSYRPDGAACIKVLDFGISKFTRGGDAITKTSTLMGSPLYMAPEQLASAKHVDPRVDVWAMGVILYELVTGELPFQGDTLPQICTSVLHGDAKPIHDHLPELPSALWTVLEHTFAKIPDDRYANLATFSRDLCQFGGESARASAAYIARVLGNEPIPPAQSWDSSVRASIPEGLISGEGAAPTVRESDTLPRVEAATVPSGDFSAAKAVGSATSAPVVTDSMYVQRPRMGMWVALAAAVSLIIIILGVSLVNDDGAGVEAAAEVLSGAATVAPAGETIASPSETATVEPTSPPIEATAEPTATASATAKPKARPRPVYVPAKPKPTPKAVPPPKPKPKVEPPPPNSNVDPFSER
jgi:eukaryotic-like serine/threonine-protein kinase